MAKASSSKARQKKELLGLYRQALNDGVPLDELDSKVNYFLRREKANKKVEKEIDQKIRSKFWQRLPLIVRLGASFLPLALIVIGLTMALSAAWPLIEYYLPGKTEKNISLLSPIPHSELLNSTPLLSAQAKIESKTNNDFAENVLDEPIILDQTLDFTDLSNWFSNDLVVPELVDSQFVEYRLDIPALDISNTKVRVGGTDLNQSLIQYPGTALPGQLGSPVIFGHSTLRQLYNPSEKNTKRYSSIFSKIMLLERGDKIFLTHNNVKYTYLVQDNIEVKPDDTFILAQRLDVHQLKLVTCVPEGTTLRRGVVTAQLVKD